MKLRIFPMSYRVAVMGRKRKRLGARRPDFIFMPHSLCFQTPMDNPGQTWHHTPRPVYDCIGPSGNEQAIDRLGFTRL